MKAIRQSIHQLVYGVLITFVVLITGFLNPNAAAATTYYVATTGKDTNQGTQISPFRTIAKGLSVVKAGDKLYIRAGTYTETIDSNNQTIPTGTSWSNAPVIAASPGETVVLNGSGGQVIGLAHGYIQYVIFDGLVIDATNATFGIGTHSTPHHVRFINVEVKNARGSGILGGGDGFEYINMKVHDNGRTVNLDHGFYLTKSNQLVDKCEVYNNAAFGVHIYTVTSASGSRANNNTVRNNLIHNNAKLGAGAGILLGSGDGNTAYNNIVIKNSGYGIQVSSEGPTNTKVYNNTIYGNKYSGVAIFSRSLNTIVRNNILSQNGGTLSDSGTGTIQSNNVTSDPKFSNASTLDFSLQAGSPAIDAGIKLSEVVNDITGAPRPQGATYDIGAHEYHTSSIFLAAPTNLRKVP
jgi:parallel beta-helix repeat protein